MALRVLLFVALSLGWNGYVFGVADHGIHLVFVDRLRHPQRWTGDLLDAAASHHPSLLWWIEAGAAQLVGLPIAFAALHLLSLAATGLAIDWLVRSLGGSRWSSLVALVLLAPAQFALGGVPTHDPHQIPPTAALPIEIGALALLARERRRAAFVVLGAAACLHAPSAAGLAFAACLVLLISPGLRAPQRLTPPLFFFVGASPILAVWAQGGGATETLTVVDSAWMQIIDARLSHHINPASWPLSEWGWMAIWMVAGLLAFHGSALPRRHRTLLVGTVAGLALWAFVAGSVLARMLHLALALQLEPWECCRLITVALACVVGLRLGQRTDHHPRGRKAVLILTVVGISLILSSESLDTQRRWLPDGASGPQRDLAEWTAEHLPAGSVIAWPPQTFHEQRWRAQHPGTSTWKDGGEGLFDRAIAERWLEQTRTRCACDPLDSLTIQDGRTPGRLSALRHIVRSGWSQVSAQEQVRTARDQGASHVVLSNQGRRAPPSPAEPLYDNGVWCLVPTEPAP